MATRSSSPAAVNTLGWLRRTTRLAAGVLLATLGASAPILLADPVSPVTITIVDSPDPVASGAQLLYTITMVNTGGAKITNVLLANQVNGVGGIGVPPQLQITSTRGSCTQTGNLVNCNAGAIEGNGSWVVTIRGVVTAASGTVLNETATVSGTKSAQNFTTTQTATTLVSGGNGTPLPDLTLAKAGPTTVVAGAPMTYTLTINNVGTANATGVRVVDTVPAGLTSITAAGTSLFVCGVAGQTVTCNGGAVNQGSNATVTINANAPAAAGTITNTAVVDPNNTIVESDELNNTSALVNTAVTASAPPPTGLSINLTDGSEFAPGPPPAWAVAAGPDPVKPGQTLTYKIHVVNTATSRADNVRTRLASAAAMKTGGLEHHRQPGHRERLGRNVWRVHGRGAAGHLLDQVAERRRDHGHDDHRAGDHLRRIDHLRHGDRDREHLEQRGHRDGLGNHGSQARRRSDGYQVGHAGPGLRGIVAGRAPGPAERGVPRRAHLHLRRRQQRHRGRHQRGGARSAPRGRDFRSRDHPRRLRVRV